MTGNPCPISAAAASLFTERARVGVTKYGTTLADAGLSSAELVQHAREEAADLLVYLTGLEASMIGAENVNRPTLADADRISRAQDISGMPPSADGTIWGGDPGHHTIPDRFATPAQPAVTREAVTAIVTGSAPMCQRRDGSCGDARDCYCRRTIDAIMALIGGAP